MLFVNADTMVEQIKELLEYEGSKFLKDKFIVFWLQKSIDRHYTKIVSLNEDYYTTPFQINLQRPSSNIDLSELGVYKIRGVDYLFDDKNRFSVLKNSNWAERNKYSYYQNYASYYRGFRDIIFDDFRTFQLFGTSQLKIYPENSNAGKYRIWIIPNPPKLTYNKDPLFMDNFKEDLLSSSINEAFTNFARKYLLEVKDIPNATSNDKIPSAVAVKLEAYMRGISEQNLLQVNSEFQPIKGQFSVPVVFEEVVILDAAIAMRIREKIPYDDIYNRYQMCLHELMDSASNREASSVSTMTDVDEREMC